MQVGSFGGLPRPIFAMVMPVAEHASGFAALDLRQANGKPPSPATSPVCGSGRRARCSPGAAAAPSSRHPPFPIVPAALLTVPPVNINDGPASGLARYTPNRRGRRARGSRHRLRDSAADRAPLRFAFKKWLSSSARPPPTEIDPPGGMDIEHEQHRRRLRAFVGQLVSGTYPNLENSPLWLRAPRHGSHRPTPAPTGGSGAASARSSSGPSTTAISAQQAGSSVGCRI